MGLGQPSLPYWQRVWIQQERVLCRTFGANLVRCGADAAAFEDFILFFTLIFALDRRAITPPEVHWSSWSVWMQTLKLPIPEPVVKMRALWKRGFPLRISCLHWRSAATLPTRVTWYTDCEAFSISRWMWNMTRRCGRFILTGTPRPWSAAELEASLRLVV